MDKDKTHLSSMGIAQIAKLSLYSKNKSKLKQHVISNISNELKKSIEDLPFKSKLIDSDIIDPWYITGMIQGDGSLYVHFPREHTNFALGQEIESLVILKDIKNYFNNIGHIYKINDTYYRYQIYKKDDIINILIPHLRKYPLYCIKGSDFEKLINFTVNSDATELEKAVIYNLSFNGKRRREKRIV
jgi:hypothetical protein